MEEYSNKFLQNANIAHIGYTGITDINNKPINEGDTVNIMKGHPDNLKYKYKIDFYLGAFFLVPISENPCVIIAGRVCIYNYFQQLYKLGLIDCLEDGGSCLKITDN